ncbi:MAG: hypothetical protein IT385_02485 [Deltaproteobacteria bacterium]|nr:hypothetical protein [Deltaproteobacteria bacterium]
MTATRERLRALLASVRLELAERDGAEVVIWEGRPTPIPGGLPLDDLDPAAEAGELMAVAAALEAAVKYPGRDAPGEELRTGAAALLCKLERVRFARTYDAVRPDAPLLWRELGGGLAACYVEDQGWRFQYMTRVRFGRWDTTLDTVHSVARSNLYHRAAVDYAAREVAHGDGYDAARAVMLDDVFYDRSGDDGITFAVPGRDLLLVPARGEALDRLAVRAAYEAARYPISPEVFTLRAHVARVVPPTRTLDC